MHYSIPQKCTYSILRKQEIYTMLWKHMDLSKYLIAGAPYGGPIGKRKKRASQLFQIEQ